MNENPSNADRLKNIILILTLVNTIFAALLSGLEVDAGIRANDANRDSHHYAALASSELVRQGYKSSYDFQTFAIALKASQEMLINEFSALGLEQDGEKDGAQVMHIQSQVAQAKADAAQKFSVFYTNPRYAPGKPDDMPKAELYIQDLAEIANDIVAKQNAASDKYQFWSKKSDAYVAVLTLLAIIFFLLGVAQSAKRMRPFFAISASVFMLISFVWTVLIVIG